MLASPRELRLNPALSSSLAMRTDGDEGSGDKIPGGSTLQFEVELVNIKKKPPVAGGKKKKKKKKKAKKAKDEV